MPRTTKGGRIGAVESEVTQPAFLRTGKLADLDEQTFQMLVAAADRTRLENHRSYALLGILSLLASATIVLGRIIEPLGDALHQVAHFLVR